jgi:diguanylate cyclase (GGDEF)-like protein
LDIKTLMITTAALSLAAGVVMLILLRTQRTYPGFGWWAFGIVSIALGTIMFGVRGAHTGWLLLLGSNSLLVLGYLLVYHGMLVFRGRSEHRWLQWGIFLTFFLVFGYYCSDRQDIAARITVYSLYITGLLLAIAESALGPSHQKLGVNEILLATWMMLMGGLTLYRAWHAIAGHATDPLWMQETGFQSYYVLAQVLTVQLSTLALIGIHAQRIEHDYLVLQGQLRAQSTHDPLTGLYNRRYLDETLADEMRRSERDGHNLCVAMLDIDHFKRINDTYGHEAGDDVLRTLGTLFMQWARASDIVCRYGGEEFSIILRDTTLDQVMPRINALRESIAQAKFCSGSRQLPSVTISIGVAQSDAKITNPVAFLNRADAAMYRAKQNGRNRVERD